MRLYLKFDAFSVTQICCFLRVSFILRLCNFVLKKRTSHMQNHVFYVFKVHFAYRKSNIMWFRNFFFDEFKNAFSPTLHEKFSISDVFGAFPQPFCPSNFFRHIFTSDKNNIMLLNFKLPRTTPKKPLHRLT